MQMQLATPTDTAAGDARDVLGRLEEMAQVRIDLFYDRIG